MKYGAVHLYGIFPCVSIGNTVQIVHYGKPLFPDCGSVIIPLNICLICSEDLKLCPVKGILFHVWQFQVKDTANQGIFAVLSYRCFSILPTTYARFRDDLVALLHHPDALLCGGLQKKRGGCTCKGRTAFSCGREHCHRYKKWSGSVFGKHQSYRRPGLPALRDHSR